MTTPVERPLYKPHYGGGFMEAGFNWLSVSFGVKDMAEGIKSFSDAGESWWKQDYQGFSHASSGASGVFDGTTNVMYAGLFAAGSRANKSWNGVPFTSPVRKVRNTLSGKGFTGDRLGAQTVLDDVGFIEKKGPFGILSSRKHNKSDGFWIKDTKNTFKHSSSGEVVGAADSAVFQKKLKPVRLFSNAAPVNLLKIGAAELSTTEVIGGGFGLAKEAGMLMRSLRFMGTGWGAAALIGAQVVGSYVVGKATSLVGGLMDEAHLAYDQGKYVNYDTRQFNNRAMQQWGMNVGQAMGTYESNNMSISRAYHSRG